MYGAAGLEGSETACKEGSGELGGMEEGVKFKYFEVTICADGVWGKK